MILSLERLRTAYRKDKNSLSRNELYDLIEMIFSIAMKQDETRSLIISSLDKIHTTRIKELEDHNKKLQNELTPEQNMIQ